MVRAQTFRDPARVEEMRSFVIPSQVPVAERFLAFSQDMSPTANGQIIQFQIRNPARSGVVLLLERLVVFVSQTRRMNYRTFATIVSDFGILAIQLQRNPQGRSAKASVSLRTDVMGSIQPTVRFEGGVHTSYVVDSWLTPGAGTQFQLGQNTESLASDVWNLVLDWAEVPMT